MFSIVDFAGLACFLCAVTLIGVACHRCESSDDLFFAGRRYGWGTTSFTLAAALVTGQFLFEAPANSYYLGMRCLTIVAAIWISAPFVLRYVIPIYRGLVVASIYEYLEHRFDVRTRIITTIFYFLWRLVWLAVLLSFSCQILVFTAATDLPISLMIILVGTVTTVYTTVGGIRAVVWTSVLQVGLLVTFLVALLVSIIGRIDGAVARVWQLSEMLDRDEIFSHQIGVTDIGTMWTVIPAIAMIVASFWIVDQVTAHGYLIAVDDRAAKRSFFTSCLIISLVTPALTYIGMCLMAYYHDHPSKLRAKWVVSVDPETRRYRTRKDIDGESNETDASEPLLNWERDRVDTSTIDEMIDGKRLLRANSRELVADRSEIVSEETGEIQVDRLVMRMPMSSELVIHERAAIELMPSFIVDNLRWGMAGLFLVAVIAMMMSSLDLGLNALGSLVITDSYRRFRWGKIIYSRLRSKPIEKLDSADELRAARVSIALIGGAVTLIALLFAQLNSDARVASITIYSFAGPLLAMTCLGLLVRRCTSTAALLGFVIGIAVTTVICIVNGSAKPLNWPTPHLAGISNLMVGAATTLVVGFVFS